MAHMWRVAFSGAIVAVTTLGACALKTDGTGAGPGPIGGQGTGGVPGEGGTGGGGAAEGGTGGTGAGEGGSGAGISGSGTGGNAGGGSAGMSGGSSGGGAGGSAGADSAGASGTGGAGVCGGKASGKTNVITCENFQDCTGSESPKCPAGGEACEIRCSGDQSCFNAPIDCNGSLDCTVRCSGFKACQSAEVLCGPGTCKVLCGIGGPLDTTTSCSSDGVSGDMIVNCSGTTGDCTICGINEPGVSVENTQACTTSGCACGDVGECG